MLSSSNVSDRVPIIAKAIREQIETLAADDDVAELGSLSVSPSIVSAPSITCCEGN